MNNLSLQELENIATYYEKLMVPAIFVGWPEMILDKANINSEDRILDVACGTGALTRAAAGRSGQNGFVSGLDMNPGMLSVASKQAPDIEWREGMAEELPWEDESFNAVVSQFGLMFFEDKPAALREMFRVLKPGGRMVIAVFDSLDNIPGYDSMVRIFERIAGEEVAQALRFPFSLGDTDKLKSIISESGLVSAKITTHQGMANFPDVRSMVLADVKGWFPLAGFVLDDNQIDEVVDRATSDLKEFIGNDGSLSFPMPAHFITVTKN